MRLLVQHRSVYRYREPTALGPHLVRLRPAAHARARIESYTLEVVPHSNVRWQQDPSGNRIARLSFEAGSRVSELDLRVELALTLEPVNPFDFFLDAYAEQIPFGYPPTLEGELAPYRVLDTAPVRTGERFKKLASGLPTQGDAVSFLSAYNQAVHRHLKYVVRDEPGIWTPEETLTQGRGSCRDFAVLLMTLLRRAGLASRFASGYLIQIKDEGMLPDEPRGVSRDVVDLHAWAEVFLPGAGWIGLDATSGLWCGEGHVPLACAADPALASPVDGTSDRPASAVHFEMAVGRLREQPRPTAPFSDEVWEGLLAGASVGDAVLERSGLSLTSGGEPTFISREHPELPEWNGAALGESKWKHGLRLAEQLRKRLSPGAAVLRCQGKHYPGETLPRWALEICGRRKGAALWPDDLETGWRADPQHARRFADALSTKLGFANVLIPAFEDPWRHLQQEASLPSDVDPLHANLTDPEERQRLARILDRGLGTEAGFALPLACVEGVWRSAAWSFRRGHLFLIPGDSSIGLRLPLASLRPGEAVEAGGHLASKPSEPVRTALCVEAREGAIYVFLPPLSRAEDFCTLVEAVHGVGASLRVPVLLEGYPPPSSPSLYRLSVTPDPGVLEVNVPPSSSAREHAQLLLQVFDAALHAGLHSQKFLLDGRLAGSGGGHHLTLGGPETRESPLLRRPSLLASLITFVQHHPSLSYLFNGLFVGPTSQAPRVDEARHEALYELEIALARAFKENPVAPPELVDGLFRNLLVDVSGNTHRTELCLDKLYDERTPRGRQGLVELRAFEMPPHPRLAAAQALLVRTLIASFSERPYRGPLIRWGSALHDRFMLPHALWADFLDVLAHLESTGLGLPSEAFRAFLELRCPVVGRLEAPGVTVEVRNALEPWPVLGEEPGGGGTSRFVDSSVERIEVRTEGLVPDRHVVLVNGITLPMRPTGAAGEHALGVRFRAWAPEHSLQPHLGIHHPLRIELVDRFTRRGLAGAAYHVWHPEGRAFNTPPLTLAEAAARRAQRFTHDGPRPWPVSWHEVSVSAEAPFTLDLRRFPGDRAPPHDEAEAP